MVRFNEPLPSAEGTAGTKLCPAAIFLPSFQDYRLMHQRFHGLASMANACRAFSTKLQHQNASGWDSRGHNKP